MLKSYLKSIADCIRDKTFKPNLLDKDNIVFVPTTYSDNRTITENGISFTGGSGNKYHAYCYIDLGLASKYTGKSVTFSVDLCSEPTANNQKFGVALLIENISSNCTKTGGYSDSTKKASRMTVTKTLSDTYNTEHLIVELCAEYYKSGEVYYWNNLMLKESSFLSQYEPYSDEQPLINAQKYCEGINEACKIASKEGEGDFFNRFTAYGTRTHYQGAFAYWGDTELNLPYQIRIYGSGIEKMFYYSKLKKISSKDIDCSLMSGTLGNVSSGYLDYTFGYCSELEEIEDIGIGASTMRYTFSGCKKLKTIAIIRSDASMWYNNAFSNCTSLENITFDGVIGQKISFSYSPLNVESMKSVITHLKNYAGTDKEYTYTLTLKASCVTELETADFTDEDKEWLTENGMEYTDDLTWVTVIDNLKWNLVSA